MICDSVYGNYRTRKFADIWPSADAFIQDYQASAIPQKLKVADATTLYYLLYARYGNSSIANSDENQFKYKIFSTIYIGGATWAKKQEIQDKLREMTEDEILAGTKAIYNHAFNPQTAPTTNTVDELEYINEQNTTKYKKSKLDGYALLWAILNDGVTETFLREFRYHFLVVVEPQLPLWYVTDISGDAVVDGQDNGPNFAV
jgi:hypothetical protein|nr:MAG TPA: hypothetical protein [Bacteriophage sp.]